MWLLPAFATLSRVIAETYYKLEMEGKAVPAEGPVLIVANHPNSLLDPAMVAAAAGRPVRFLAKSGLFKVPVIKWLVAGAGAIPVYRKQDDPALMERNDDTFSAAYTALAEGSTVGIFPEGISHDEPSMVQLKTGAARIALGAAKQLGRDFPVVPIGLVFRRKEIFRSEALVVTGDPVRWRHLAHLGQEPEAVRQMTHLIEEALRSVTINLERWEDAPLVEAADAIWVAELGGGRSPAARVGRVREGARKLAEGRRSGDPRWVQVARDVLRHGALLKRIGLTPGDLAENDTLPPSLLTGAMRPFSSLLTGAGWLLGATLFWVPYRLVGVGDTMLKPDVSVRSTTKVLAGVVVFTLWVVLLALLVGFATSAIWGVLTLLLLPLAGLLTLRLHEAWEEDRREWRRLVVSRTRRRRFLELRERQRELAVNMALLINPAAAQMEMD